MKDTHAPRPARYAPAGVVVLSRQDAFAVMQLLDSEKVRKARNGTLEPAIGSLQALSAAADDWAAFMRDRGPAAPVKVTPILNQSVTPKWVADRLNIKQQAVTLACREGRIPGAEQVDGRWTIPIAGYKHYQDTRSK